ncbi:hypothetical protein RCOM_1340080 [Ricinus communis]|uniref:Cyanobacterial aminoacyl-tRNA synthetase CAAD domain-containing protein n=1 Tax=Ricinus communis TaxID=3988 RepID=B9RMU7_RICCO|nr:hypothetical protein RCOM_1340080 [Ricinus communis]
MASTSSSTLSISSSSSLIDAKAPRQSAAASPQCVTLPTLPPPPVQSQNRPWKATAYCRKMARNVMALATGEAPAEVATAEVPEIIKTVQEAAIDRIPLVPGVLEVVGIGYSGWFAYKNLVFKPDREALLEKIKATYKDIIGSS